MPPFFDPLTFTLELAFTIISFVFCIIIFFKTKESYDLTKHVGIKYFRDAFLFFGLSYVLRFIFGIFMITELAEHPHPGGPGGWTGMLFFILLLGYFSTAGILYLLFGSVWKKVHTKYTPIIIHGAAIILSLAAFLTRSHIILLIVQSVLLILAVVLNLVQPKKKVTNTRVLYFLILAVWLINLWIIDRRRPYSLEIEILFQIISLLVFVLIIRKISKWVR